VQVRGLAMPRRRRPQPAAREVRARLLVLLTVALVAILPACRDGAEQVDDASVGHPAAVSTPPAPTPAEKFAAYLASVEKWRAPANAQLRRFNKAVKQSSDTCCSGWDHVAAVGRTTARRYKRTADELAAISPPPGLVRPHQAYAAGWRTDAQAIDDIAAAYKHPSAYTNWNSLYAPFRATDRTVTRYRIALIAYATREGFKIPRWVHTIGGA